MSGIRGPLLSHRTVGGTTYGVTVPTLDSSARFHPTRSAGLDALADFVPSAGRDYAATRNQDRGPGDRTNVSTLSPYIRHRLITEAEVVREVLSVHSPSASEKFVQEVFWRTYWKGWLELRPDAWRRYRRDVERMLPDVDGDYWAAVEARTGIDCFDAWILELIDTGYLHNHTRMWFASIWIFTLGLPWQLGADFFLRHLLDGDPASNTLSWRWVAGLQTAGKTYLATADNISRYTDGRFSPRGLASSAVTVTEAPLSAPLPLEPSVLPPRGRAGLLLLDDDLHPESLPVEGVEVVAVGGVTAVGFRSPASVSNGVRVFTEGAMSDALSRGGEHYGAPAVALAESNAATILKWARQADVSTVITPYAPVGPAEEQLRAVGAELAAAGVSLTSVRREWDTLAWPHARRGFFAFRENIPRLVREQGISGGSNRGRGR